LAVKKTSVSNAQQTGTPSENSLNALIIDSIQDIKGKNIVKMDLRHLHDAPTDYFIVCQGDSNVQVRSIAENIHKRAKQELGVVANHIEGAQASRWVLVDFFNVVVHVFYPETRAFYQIEDLWSDAKTTVYEDIA
jgi:ribosome-associated protein